MWCSLKSGVVVVPPQRDAEPGQVKLRAWQFFLLASYAKTPRPLPAIMSRSVATQETCTIGDILSHVRPMMRVALSCTKSTQYMAFASVEHAGGQPSALTVLVDCRDVVTTTSDHLEMRH